MRPARDDEPSDAEIDSSQAMLAALFGPEEANRLLNDIQPPRATMGVGLEWWNLHPIIAPLPKGFMDDDTSHAEAHQWMGRASDEITRLRTMLSDTEANAELRLSRLMEANDELESLKARAQVAP